MTEQHRSSRFRPSLRRALAALAVMVIGGAAVAFAAGPGRHAFMQRMLRQRVEAALDAASASPAQRAAIHAAIERAVTKLRASHPAPGAGMERAARWFGGDSSDPAELQALRAEQLGRLREMGDTIEGVLHETHDALTPQQRRALASYLRERLPLHRGMDKRWSGFVERRIEALLAAAQPTAAQREELQATRAELRTAFEANRPRPELLAEALGLFEADRWDEARVSALRTAQEAAFGRLGDAIVQAVVRAHDTLTPAQRQSVVAHLRAARERHHARLGAEHPAFEAPADPAQ